MVFFVLLLAGRTIIEWRIMRYIQTAINMLQCVHGFEKIVDVRDINVRKILLNVGAA